MFSWVSLLCHGISSYFCRDAAPANGKTSELIKETIDLTRNDRIHLKNLKSLQQVWRNWQGLIIWRNTATCKQALYMKPFLMSNLGYLLWFFKSLGSGVRKESSTSTRWFAALWRQGKKHIVRKVGKWCMWKLCQIIGLNTEASDASSF